MSHKRTDVGLAFLLGLASLIVHVAINANFPHDGVIATIARRMVYPGVYAGFYIFRHILPDYFKPGSDHRYVMPLIPGLGETLWLTALWFICIRIVRIFRSKDRNSEEPSQQ